MESVSRKELETFTLRKYDRNAVEIIESAPLVGAYMFDKDQLRWVKLKCEGILFLYCKHYEPQFNLFLLNRLNNLHLYQPISSNLKLQVEDSYLLFRNDEGTIFGLWIHDKQVFTRISEELKKVIYNINLKTFCKIPLHNDEDEKMCKVLRKTEEEYLRSFYGLNHLQMEKENDSCITPESVAKFFEDAGKVIRGHRNTIKSTYGIEKRSDNILKSLICTSEYNVENIEKNQQCSKLSDD